jgi:hypothetical protein
MSQNAKIEARVDTPLSIRQLKFFLTPTDTMDELKSQINKCFVYLGENHTTSHVFVQVPCVDLRADKD